MAQPRASKSSNTIRGRLELAGAEAQHLEQLVVETVDPAGKRATIDRAADGSLEFDRSLVGKGYRVKLHAKEGGEPRVFSLDTVADRLSVDKAFTLPAGSWNQIFPIFTCVSGHVQVCRPIWIDPVADVSLRLASELRTRPFESVLADISGGTGVEIAKPFNPSAVDLIPYPWPPRCQVVCSGKVDVFIRTCCCRPRPPEPPIIIDKLCEIIDCGPPFPPRPPEPDPPYFVTDRAWTDRLAKRVQTASPEPGAPSGEDLLRLADHLTTLRSLPLEGQRAYIEATPELYYWGCTCSTKQVATTYLNPDGTFDACFAASYTPFPCTQRVQYRVSQITPAGWQVIYDGLVSGRSFGLAENASLQANWYARGCPGEPTPVPGEPPFVLLEAIGSTWASELIHSTQQDGPDSFAGPLAASDGLAGARPTGPLPVTAGPYELAWCLSLPLRLRFHEGLKGAPINATKYRLRTVRIDANGDPIAGTEQPLAGTVTWQKYAPAAGGGVQVELRSLNTPDAGVYLIPWPDPAWPWLDGQFHANFATPPSGRYLVLVDVLRQNLDRLRPDNSLEAVVAGDVTAPFRFRRLAAPIVAGQTMSTTEVAHSTLANMFQVDNTPSVGDINQIQFAGSASSVNCQFLTGRDCDTVALRYTARQDTGFQWFHEIWYRQGLSGPTIPTVPPEAREVGSANVINGPSVARRLDSMLRGEVRCSFAANLAVYTRHTSGYGRTNAYDSGDQAAFALETIGSQGCP